MCGIGGAFSLEPHNLEMLSETVGGLINCLRHRGPDDQGVWRDPEGRAVFGHRRLSIIDLTASGHQPMLSRCGRYVITYNGEIYNFLELRKELKEIGVVFHGNSDTEVLLEAISQWGVVSALEMVIGMFAFALYDRAERALYLVRDRLGKKPLYYMVVDGVLYFASEIKGLRLLPQKDDRIDDEALNHYLTLGYIPSPYTIYRDIREVPAAHYLVNNRAGIACHSYWHLDWQPNNEAKDINELAARVESLLKDAVQRRLIADVPLGCFLSSGIDSGLCVAIASEYSSEPIITLTVCLEDELIDESKLAELTAQKFGTVHHALKIIPNIKDDLPKIVFSYDEPFADPSAIPSYLISQEARKYVKVVINGDGGDEAFGGYRRHKAMYVYSKIRPLIDIIPRHLFAALNDHLPVPHTFRSSYSFFHRFVRGLHGSPFEQYVVWSEDGFDDAEKLRLWPAYRNGGLTSTGEFLAAKFQGLEELDPVNLFMAMDLNLGLADCLLVKMDIATMAHGLEARSPFLDHRIVELASRIPPHIKLQGLDSKPILRRIARKYLPEDIVRAPKRGFEIPLIRWLQEDLFDMLYEVCLSRQGIISRLFDRKYVEDLVLQRPAMDSRRWARVVWILFMLGMWGQIHENRLNRS